MPKTASPKLFNLIKSLSAAEKRYFKVFAHEKANHNNKYLQLFDAIDKQITFDDNTLQQLIYPEEKLESRKYSELKSYLYNQIIKSLQAYDENQSIDFQLKNTLLGIRVLFKRARYDDCKELLEKASKQAIIYEDFGALIELLRWEKQIAYAEMNIVFFDTQIERIDREEKTLLLKMQNISAYRNIFLQLYISVRTGAFARQEDKLQYLYNIKKNTLLEDINLALSHTAKVLFLRIHTLYYYSILDYKNFYEYGKELVKQMEKKPHLLQEDVSEYIAALSNLCLSCGLQNRYQELSDYLNSLKKIKANTLDDRIKIHRQYYTFKFGECIYSGNFEEGVNLIHQQEQELKYIKNHNIETSSFYFNYFYVYFGCGNYSRALDYLNKWLGLPRSIERQDLQSLARLINLIIHYEMGNFLLLENLVRSTYRYLKKRERMLEFEKKILEFTHDIQHIGAQRELRKAFINLKNNLEKLQSNPAEEAMLRYFDIISWLESKIENRNFADIVKERYQRIITTD